MRKRTKLILLIIAAVLFIIAAVIVIIPAIQAGDFASRAEKVVQVPDLNSGFVPQGLEFLPESGVYLVSGYLGETAQIKVVGENESRSVSLYNADGSDFSSHAGGVCRIGDFVYISGEKSIYAFKLDDVLSGSAELVGKFPTNNRASFCFADEKYLYVGEYYFGTFYPTAESHHIKTPAGDENNALVFAFPIDENQSLGVKTEPEFAFSTTGSVQGMEIAEGKAFLSASDRISGSRLLSYDISRAKIGQFGEIPLIYLDSSNLVGSQPMFPQSEGIVFALGKIHILFESAANKYLIGRIFGADYIYSLAI